METLKSAKSKLAAANKEITGFIGAFVDDSSFVETDAFVCSQNDFGEMPSEGVVSGIATIDSRYVCVFATNPEVLKGSIGAVNAKKIVRTVNNAVKTGRPLIAVLDTSGARITEGLECLEGYADIFKSFTVASANVPVITVVKGKNLGHLSYLTSMSDFIIACPDAVSASASPLVISAQTGLPEKEVGSSKKLAENGMVTHIAKKTELRALITDLLSVCCDTEKSSKDDPNRVCKGLKAGVNAQAVINQIIDDKKFIPVASEYAKSVTTGFAYLSEMPVGIVAVQGKLTAKASTKINDFLHLCDKIEKSVIFLVDCSGSEITAADADLMRDMSMLIDEINVFDQTKISVVFGKAGGIAYTALVSLCDYKIAWEDASASVLESESAARLLYSDEIAKAKDKDKSAAKFASAYAEENASAMVVALSGHFDNVVNPNHTRAYLINTLMAFGGVGCI